MTASIKNYLPYLLPLLLVFSRSLADITIVLISILFLYHSYTKIGWHWVKEKWFCFALIFTIYCLTINSAMSIDPTETLAYWLFFFRIFTIAFKTLSALSLSKLSTFKILNFPLSSSDLTAEVVAPNKARPFLFKHDAI